MKQADPSAAASSPVHGGGVTGLRRAEWAVAILLTVMVLSFMVVRAIHAGGLWRDECAALQLARLPTFGDVLQHFQHEAFPPPFYAGLRVGTKLFGTSDVTFRVFGLLVGVLLLAVLWFNARLLTDGPPLLALALLGLNATVLTWTTTIRGYGLGCAFLLLTFGLVASGLVHPTRRWVIAGLMAALVAVHCLLSNSFIIAAIGGSAACVLLLRRKRKSALVVLLLGGVCAASVLPYARAYSSGREWDVLLKYPIGFTDLLQGFNGAIAATRFNLSWVWYGLFIALVVGGLWHLRKLARGKPAPERDWIPFAMLAAAASLAGYYAFLKTLSYRPNPWHYLALLFVLAAAMDLLAQSLAQIRWVRLARLGFVILAAIMLPFLIWPRITTRQTNIDLFAKRLEQDAKPGDLIVLAPWFYGVTFNWYYHGKAPWVTMPMISDHQMHRYDLVKERMMSTTPLDDLRDAIGRTLQGGGRVWMVGYIVSPTWGVTPAVLPPAPHPQSGWLEEPYFLSWVQHINGLMLQHGNKAGVVTVPFTGRVSEFEKVEAVVVEGWH